MKKDTKVKHITLEIVGIEVKVTPQQAEQLYCALATLLGKPTTTYYSPWTYTNGIATSANYTNTSGDAPIQSEIRIN